jgi:hypothetical protein
VLGHTGSCLFAVSKAFEFKRHSRVHVRDLVSHDKQLRSTGELCAPGVPGSSGASCCVQIEGQLRVEAESYIVHSRSKHQDRSGAFAFDLVFRQGSKGFNSLKSTVLEAIGRSGLGRSSLVALVSCGSSVSSLSLGVSHLR